MGNMTTVKDVSIGGALAVITLWLVGFFCPELVASLPAGGEAAISLLFTSLFAYFKEPAKARNKP